MNFKILSYDEEKKLSNTEKIEYYKNLKKYLEEEKFSIPKDLYLKICNCLNIKVVRGVIDKIKGYDLEVRGLENIPDGPVIYASTHQDYNDHFNVVLSIPEHSIILNTSNVTPIFKLIMGVNGIEYVTRNDKNSRFKSKNNLIHYLSHNKSIVIFPEGTYNCSPNKLHLPFHRGVIDIARKSGCPIVPLIQEYKYDAENPTCKSVASCVVEFSKPIEVNYEDSKDDKIEELSDAFSTVRYKLIEEKGLFKRDDIKNSEYINYILGRIDGWDKVKVSIDDERKTIYGYDDFFYRSHYINDVSYDEKGNLLEFNKSLKLRR